LQTQASKNNVSGLWDDDRVHSAVAWLKCTEAVSGNFF